MKKQPFLSLPKHSKVFVEYCGYRYSLIIKLRYYEPSTGEVYYDACYGRFIAMINSSDIYQNLGCLVENYV